LVRAVLSSVLIVAAGASAQPSIQAIGGVLQPEGHAVSADGRFVAGNNTFPTAHAFRWTSTGGTQLLGSVPMGINSHARGVSADGSIVVGSGVTELFGVSSRAFRWTEATGMQMLPAPSGFGDVYGQAVSGDGSVIVGHSPTVSPTALRWDASGVQVLPPLQNGWAAPYAVSGDGSRIVGISNSRAVYWDASGSVHDVGMLPGSISSEFSGASWDGSVLVGEATTPTFQRVPYYWTAASGMVPLPMPGSDGQVNAVSGDGNYFVGTYYSGGRRAAIWTPDRQFHPLDDYLASLGVNVSGWNLIEANAISADGRTIVGRGRNGNQWGFVAVIPSPGSAVVGSVAFLISMRRRRQAPTRTRQR
jgi:uncharacterized membrane protein